MVQLHRASQIIQLEADIQQHENGTADVAYGDILYQDVCHAATLSGERFDAPKAVLTAVRGGFEQEAQTPAGNLRRCVDPALAVVHTFAAAPKTVTLPIRGKIVRTFAHPGVAVTETGGAWTVISGLWDFDGAAVLIQNEV